MPLDHLTPASGLAESFAALVGVSLALLVPLWVLLSVSIARRRLARETEEALLGASSLREGARVIAGRADVGVISPVTVRLVESGEEWRAKGRTHHKWREVSREVRAEPFDVIVGETRVRVEPGSEVFIVDDMQVVDLDRVRKQRERLAKLSAGEEVTVTGQLVRVGGSESAYRGAPAQWVLRPPARGPMLIATQPLAPRHRFWSGFWARAAIVPALMLVVVHGLAAHGFYRFVLTGERDVGTVVDHDTYLTHYRGSTTTHYELRVRVRDRETYQSVTAGGYHRATLGSPVAVVVTPDGDVRLGSEPGFPVAIVFVPILLCLFASLVVWLQRRARALWWEQKRAVSFGPGPL